jgi:hypothetical protein
MRNLHIVAVITEAPHVCKILTIGSCPSPDQNREGPTRFGLRFRELNPLLPCQPGLSLPLVQPNTARFGFTMALTTSSLCSRPALPMLTALRSTRYTPNPPPRVDSPRYGSVQPPSSPAPSYIKKDSLSPCIVGNYLRNIYAKSGRNSRGEAVHWAVSSGLVSMNRDRAPAFPALPSYSLELKGARRAAS